MRKSKLSEISKYLDAATEADASMLDFEETVVSISDVEFVTAEPVSITTPWLPAVGDILTGYITCSDLNTMYGVRTQMTIKTEDKKRTVWVNGAFKRVLRDIKAVDGDFLAIKCVSTEQWNGNTVRYYAAAKITPTF